MAQRGVPRRRAGLPRGRRHPTTDPFWGEWTEMAIAPALRPPPGLASRPGARAGRAGRGARAVAPPRPGRVAGGVPVGGLPDRLPGQPRRGRRGLLRRRLAGHPGPAARACGGVAVLPPALAAAADVRARPVAEREARG